MNWKNIHEEYPDHTSLIIYRDDLGGLAKCAFHMGYGFSQHQILVKNGTENVAMVEWIYAKEMVVKHE